MDFCTPVPRSGIFRFSCGKQKLKSSTTVTQHVMAPGLSYLKHSLFPSRQSMDFSFLLLKPVSLLHSPVVSFSLFLPPRYIFLSLLHFFLTHTVSETCEEDVLKVCFLFQRLTLPVHLINVASSCPQQRYP